MNMYEIVVKLIGWINPVGETNTDNDRFENLKESVELINALVSDLVAVSNCESDQRASLNELVEEIKGAIDAGKS